MSQPVVSAADQTVSGFAVRHRGLPGCLPCAEPHTPLEDAPSLDWAIDEMMGWEHVLLSQHAPDDTIIDMALKSYHANAAAASLETVGGVWAEGGRQIRDEIE